MAKAWITERTREVARLGREMMGGNGIITDNYAMKALTDAEIAYTYEGTYDINSLIAGRELTGIAAFKVSGASKKK
jgi:acyl-CoA oxidase